MRFYLLSDNIDTQMGMRLAGIEGVVVHEADEVKEALYKACDMRDGTAQISETINRYVHEAVGITM